jgi:hypothetical protein
MPMPPYRCAACVGQLERCPACRSRRRAAKVAAGAANVALGRCRRCSRVAVEGQTLCRRHRAANRRAVRGSKARAAGLD